jgi:predicted transcriptional regulator
MKEDRSTNLPIFRPGNEGLQKMLGKLEAQVMEAMWASEEPLCVEEVRAALADSGKDAAYTTIMTTMSRLHSKGLLTRDMKGKAYYYSPKVSRRELTSNVTKQVIDGLLTAFAEPTMAYFVEALSDEDPDKLEALASLIQQKRQSRTKKQEG